MSLSKDAAVSLMARLFTDARHAASDAGFPRGNHVDIPGGVDEGVLRFHYTESKITAASAVLMGAEEALDALDTGRLVGLLRVVAAYLDADTRSVQEAGAREARAMHEKLNAVSGLFSERRLDAMDKEAKL